MHASLPDVDPLIARLADAIAPTLTPDTVIVGIHTGGVWVAERLHAMLHCALPLGTLDISFYRDDFSRIGLHPQVKPSSLPVDLEGRAILLVDDVLHTGRTVRAAMKVLVDRGGHELPIRPDFAGVALDVPAHQNINLSRLDDGHLTLTLA